MNGPLRVAAVCPTCGASVEFEEGSQIFRCDYCASVLWITGYQQTLTYHILPKLSRPSAARAALRALRVQFPGFHLEEMALSFIPYYRYSGTTCWLDEEQAETLSEEDEKTRRNALLWASEAGHGSSVDMERTQWVMKSRREEKNFIGTGLSVAGLYSLGVRASVLPLSVFQPELLQKKGALFPVTQTEKNAMEIGQKAEGRRHQAIGGRLSLIYFPFYLALSRKGEASVTLFVDGVSGEVAGSHEDEIQLPAPKGDDAFPTLRFRPLKCPNCGWNLPSRPQDVILVCATCGRAWQARGESLLEVRSEHEPPPEGTPKDRLRYLPFWVMSIRSDEALPGLPPDALLRFPAFASRNFKWAALVALSLLRIQPPRRSVPFQPGTALEGCSYVGEEARNMGRILLIDYLLQKGRSIERAEKTPIDLGEPQLVWIPFILQGIEYIEPQTGVGILKNLVI